MIHPSPPRPPPRTFYSYLFVTFMINFSTWYISHIFSSWNSNRLGPCVFSAHIKIQKGHIIKTHNCCESIKRVGTETERREKKKEKKILRQTSSLANVLYISVFYFTTRWRVHRVPSSIKRVDEWTYPTPKYNPTRIQNKPFIIPCPPRGGFNGEREVNKKQSRRKKKCSSVKSFYFCRLAKVI